MTTEMAHRRRLESGKIALVVSLAVFSLSRWRVNLQLMDQINAVQNGLRILHQMHNHSNEVCHGGKHVKAWADELKGKDHRTGVLKRSSITNKTVSDDVTFIIVGQSLHCAHDQVSWIKKCYKKAKIIVSISLRYTLLNPEAVLKNSSQDAYFLGGVNNTADAVSKAIRQVSTLYFIIIDHSIDLARMNNNFVQVLLSNMPGYDVLGGAEIIGPKQEFNIPCYRLRLKNWSLYESYEYIVNGNVLNCDGMSLFFLGRTEAFKHPTHKDLFDVNLPSKWLQDFFIRFQGIIRVGVLPEVIIHLAPSDSKCLPHLPKQVSSMERMACLLPFANKYQIFFFDNGMGRGNICENSGLVCSEENMNKKWSIGKPSSTGLTTYPFIIKSLKEALHFGGKSLKGSNLLYVVEGGTLLGLIKERDILPWDHGDIDTFVYSTRRNIINMVLKSYREHGYPYYLRHSGFHTYVSDDPTSWNGCVVYLSRRVKPKGIIYIRHNGKLFPVKRKLFAFLRELYGSSYFENRMKYTNDRNYCKYPGHHACMPDCRWHGCGGLPGSYPGIQ